MRDDNVTCFVGREDQWAALCALDGPLFEGRIPEPEEADALLDAVWEFVETECREEEQAVPSRSETKAILLEMIVQMKAEDDNSG